MMVFGVHNTAVNDLSFTNRRLLETSLDLAKNLTTSKPGVDREAEGDKQGQEATDLLTRQNVVMI